MKYSKERLAEIFSDGERLLKEFQLPTWDELPIIDLYMDQVMILLSKHLSIFSAVSNDDKIITHTMINNYVKQKIIPAPIKKNIPKFI